MISKYFRDSLYRFASDKDSTALTRAMQKYQEAVSTPMEVAYRSLVEMYLDLSSSITEQSSFSGFGKDTKVRASYNEEGDDNEILNPALLHHD